MKTKFYLKPSVLGAAVAAAAIAAGPAYALDAKISGHINRAIMSAEDGDKTTTTHVDNDNSGTRFRFTGSEDIGGGVKAGIIWEVEMQSNPSNVVSQAEPGDESPKSDTNDFGERWMDIYFSGPFGKVSFGQGDGAMNGGVQRDLSGTNVINWSGNFFLGANMRFRDSTTGLLTGVTIGDVLNDQDFESRYDRLRYDTPSFSGFSIAVSTGTQNGSGEDVVEYGLKYSGGLGGGNKLAGAVGVSTKKRGGPTDDRDTTGGSISLLLSSGLNFTLATTNVEDDGPAVGAKDSDFTYFKVGQKMGQHAVAVDFGRGEDQLTTNLGEEGEVIGIGYVYKPAKWAELYAGYKVHSLDANGASFDDITIITVGSRLKF